MIVDQSFSRQEKAFFRLTKSSVIFSTGTCYRRNRKYQLFTMADMAEEEKPVIKTEIVDNGTPDNTSAYGYQSENQFVPYNINMEHWLMEKLYRQNEMYLRSLNAASLSAAAAATTSVTQSASSPTYTTDSQQNETTHDGPSTHQEPVKPVEDSRRNASILEILNTPPFSTSPMTQDATAISNAKRKELSLKQKVDMIQSSNGKSQRQLADEFNVCKSQVHNIMKRKDEILETFEYSTPSNRKRRFIRTENEEINILTLQYYLKMKEMEVNVTGSMLQRKAREVAQQLGKTEFKASNGWLESFRKRHKIGSCYSGNSNSERLPSFPSFANIIKRQGTAEESPPAHQNDTSPEIDSPQTNETEEQQSQQHQQLLIQNGFSPHGISFVCNCNQ